MFREAASQRIETSTDRRSVTSMEDLGFSMPPKNSLCEFQVDAFGVRLRGSEKPPETDDV